MGELIESVTDTHRHIRTGKFIFCPCIALERQKEAIAVYEDLLLIMYYRFCKAHIYNKLIRILQCKPLLLYRIGVVIGLH